MNVSAGQPPLPRVVIVGGGFGGLYCARRLMRKTSCPVTVIDKRNFHLFQPLLYQVATGSLSIGDISFPLRACLNGRKGMTVLLAEMRDLDPARRRVILSDGETPYDILVVATGSGQTYFGHPEWEALAPGIKTVEDALYMRRRILLAFETAERESDPAVRREWMNFVLVGGGSTGVELAGALAELAGSILKKDFASLGPGDAVIHLVEHHDRVLPSLPEELSAQALKFLVRLGVKVRTGTGVVGITNRSVTVKKGNQQEEIAARTALWAAGVEASPIGRILAERTGAQRDSEGRLFVEPDLSLPNHPEIFVIGDLACFAHQTGEPLPGVASVAIQQGRHVAEQIAARGGGKNRPAFHYRDKGMLAVIGRNAAVAQVGRLHLWGWKAWVIWAIVHIHFLIQFENKMLVMLQWAWNYLTYKRSARLITGKDPFPLVEPRDIPSDTSERP